MGNTGEKIVNCRSDLAKRNNDLLGTINQKVETPSGVILSTLNHNQNFFIKEYCFSNQQDLSQFKQKIFEEQQTLKKKIQQEFLESHLMPIVKITQNQLNNYCSTSFKICLVYEYQTYSLYDEILNRVKSQLSKLQCKERSFKSGKQSINDFDFQPQFSASFGTSRDSSHLYNKKQAEESLKVKRFMSSSNSFFKLQLFEEQQIWCILSGSIIGVCQLIRKDGYHHNQLGLRDIKITKQGLILLLRNQMIGCQNWHQMDGFIEVASHKNLRSKKIIQNCEEGLFKLAKTILFLMKSELICDTVQEQQQKTKDQILKLIDDIDQSFYSRNLKEFIKKMLCSSSQFIYLEKQLLNVLQNQENLRPETLASTSQVSVNYFNFSNSKGMNRVSTRRLLVHNDGINNQKDTSRIHQSSKTQKFCQKKNQDQKFQSVIIFNSHRKQDQFKNQNDQQNQNYYIKQNSLNSALTNQKYHSLHQTLKSKKSVHKKRNSNRDGCLNITLKKLKQNQNKEQLFIDSTYILKKKKSENKQNNKPVY